jgi:hypothetical protein
LIMMKRSASEETRNLNALLPLDRPLVNQSIIVNKTPSNLSC